MSFLGTMFKDIGTAFKWLASPGGQTVVALGEAAVQVAVPGSTALINLINQYANQIISIETIATAAGQGTGSGIQKSAAVINAVTPSALAFAVNQGLMPPTAEQIKAQSDAIVAFLNALPSKNPTAPVLVNNQVFTPSK